MLSSPLSRLSVARNPSGRMPERTEQAQAEFHMHKRTRNSHLHSLTAAHARVDPRYPRSVRSDLLQEALPILLSLLMSRPYPRSVTFSSRHLALLRPRRMLRGMATGIPKRHLIDRRASRTIEFAPRFDDRPLTTADVASWLGVSTQWLEIGRCRGYGPRFTRISTRRVRYAREDVVAWLRSRAAERKS